jgi:hypothetical protein
MTKIVYPVPSSALDDDSSSNNFRHAVGKARTKHLEGECAYDNSISSDSSMVSGPILTRLGQTTSDGSVIPPAPPVLQRSRNLQTVYPGAVPISPLSRALTNQGGDGDSVSLQYDTNERQRGSDHEGNDDSFLVNAELVVSNEEEFDAEAQRRNDPNSLPLAHSTSRGPAAALPPVFDAKVVEEKSSPRPVQMKDFFRNKMVQVVGLFLCLIISGLIVFVVIGFDSNNTTTFNSINPNEELAVPVSDVTEALKTTFPTPSPPYTPDPTPAQSPTSSNSVQSEETDDGDDNHDEYGDDDDDDNDTGDDNHD